MMAGNAVSEQFQTQLIKQSSPAVEWSTLRPSRGMRF